MKFPNATIIIFAKAPELGKVKTRLATQLGEVVALDIYKQLLSETFCTVIDADVANVCCYSTDPNHSAFDQWKEKGVCFYRQDGEDLGERMLNAFKLELKKASSVLLLGTDCPVFEAHHFDEALSLLNVDTQAVVIPTEDGGYVLMGLNQQCSEQHDHLFKNIAWSTEYVFKQTLDVFKQLNIGWEQLETLWDVDNASDYQRWKSINN